MATLLTDLQEQRKLEEYSGSEDYVIRGELKSDPAMKQLIKIIENSTTVAKEGKFMIYNLFTLRNPNMDNALKEFINPDIDKKLLERDYQDYKDMKDEFPWTLIGWGCKDNKTLNMMKRKWLCYISENSLSNIGDVHEKNPHYYHPLPRDYNKKIEYIDCIVAKLDGLAEKV